jgi:hypothetical protein
MRGTEDSFAAVVSVRSDSILASWPRVRAAADYRIRISMADGTPLLERAVADTAIAIPLSGRRPGASAVMLADSALDLAAIRRLDLTAQLVTMSACETALGSEVRGEGIVGLSHAFLTAGARGTVVTLWPIRDRSAADFMSAFYRELSTGATPSAALLSVRRAWITAGGRQSHPSRWAPYVLVGGLDDR